MGVIESDKFVVYILTQVVLLVVFFFTSVFSSSISELNEVEGSGNPGNIVVIIYIVVLVVLYFFPLLYLFNFGSKLQTAIRTNDQVNLNAAFRSLKSCLKFIYKC